MEMVVVMEMVDAAVVLYSCEEDADFYKVASVMFNFQRS